MVKELSYVIRCVTGYVNYKCLLAVMLLFPAFFPSSIALSAEVEPEKLKEEIMEKVEKKVNEELERALQKKETAETQKGKEKKPEDKKIKHKVGEISRVMGTFSVPEGTLVQGDLSAVMSSGEIHGTIDGDVSIVLGSVMIGPNAKIKGDLNVVLGSVAEHPKATITGSKNFVLSSSSVEENMAQLKKTFQENRKRRINLEGPLEKRFLSGLANGPFKNRQSSFPWKLTLTLGYLIEAVLLYIFIPARMQNMTNQLSLYPGKSVGCGFMGILLILPVAVILIVSIIGIAVLPLYVLALVLAFSIGYICVGYLLGMRLKSAINASVSDLVALLAGVLFLELLRFVPGFGWLLRFIALTAGLGLVLFTKCGTVEEVVKPS